MENSSAQNDGQKLSDQEKVKMFLSELSHTFTKYGITQDMGMSGPVLASYAIASIHNLKNALVIEHHLQEQQKRQRAQQGE